MGRLVLHYTCVVLCFWVLDGAIGKQGLFIVSVVLIVMFDVAINLVVCLLIIQQLH